MGKKIPLTAEQEFIKVHLSPYDQVIYRWNNETHKNNRCERTPSEWRRLLKARRESVCPYGNKYENAQQAFNHLLEALKGDDAQEFENAVWRLRNAMKFQGEMQVKLVFIEHLMKGLDEAELRKRTSFKKLRTKIDNINEG